MLKQSHTDKKYLNKKSEQKTREEILKLRNDESIPFSQLNNEILNLSKVKGFFIKCGEEKSNMFSFYSNIVLEIYQATEDGKYDPNFGEPILYAVVDAFKICSCFQSQLEIVLTSKLSESESNTPFLSLVDQNESWKRKTCDIFLNSNGIGVQIGHIEKGCGSKSIKTTSRNGQELQIEESCSFCCPCCTCSSDKTLTTYHFNGAQGKITIPQTYCCYCCCCIDTPHEYEFPFPHDYTEDQKTLYLISAVYFVYINYNPIDKDD